MLIILNTKKCNLIFILLDPTYYLLDLLKLLFSIYNLTIYKYVENALAGSYMFN